MNLNFNNNFKKNKDKIVMTFLKYFQTDGIRGTVGKKPITPDFLLKLGQIIGTVLGENKKKNYYRKRYTYFWLYVTVFIRIWNFI